MIVTTSELSTMLGDPGTVIVDARPFKEYSEGHIPGAVNLDLFAFHWMDTTRQGIEAFGRQAQDLASMIGTGPGKRIVFYDSVSGMLAARGVWMLTYLSHGDVAMLDGGISRWKADGLDTETKPNAFAPSRFAGAANPGVIAGFEDVLNRPDGTVLIDARSAAEYDGSVIRAARSGHIPGAVNIDWSRNLDNDGTFRSHDELSGLYDMPRDAPVMTYCQGAYRAANSFVALKRLGFRDVRVYLGSWGEWGNRTDLPVET